MELIQTESSAGQRLQACDRCWKRKQKRLPACRACREAEVPCYSRQVSIGRATDDINALSHASVPNYVGTLKRKIEELDNQRYFHQHTRLQSRTPIESRPLAAHSDAPAVLEDGQSFDHSPATVSTIGTERSVQLAMGEIGSLSRDAMAEPRGKTQESPQTLGMRNMVKNALSLWGSNPFRSTIRSTGHEGLRDMAGNASRPSREGSTPHLDRFLNQVSIMFLHFDPVKIRSEFSGFFDTAGGTSLCSTKPYCAFHFYMAMAIGISMSPEPGTELLAVTWHNSAMKCFDLILKDNESLDVLHCIFLLIIFSIANPFGGSTWHLLGIAMKTMVSLRLHREPEAHSGALEMLESRRRFFWSLYTLDRTIGYVMDRPFNIQDSDISLQLPVRDAQMSTLCFEFGYSVVTHARLMSSMRTLSIGPSAFHYGNICHWMDLTNHIENIPSSQSGFIKQLTCRAFVQIIQLKSCAGTNAGKIGDGHKIEKDAINCCQDFIDDQYYRLEQNTFVGVFVDGLDIFAAGVLVACISSFLCPAACTSKILTVHKCTALLASVGRRFSSFNMLPKVLSDLVNAPLQDSLQNPKIIDDIPDIVPDSLLAMIMDFQKKLLRP